MVKHALQVTTIEVFAARMILRIPRFNPLGIIRLITVCKTFWKDLVPNSMLNPFWRFHHINFLAIWHFEIRTIFHNGLVYITANCTITDNYTTAITANYFKGILQAMIWCFKRNAPLIFTLPYSNFFHLTCFSLFKWQIIIAVVNNYFFNVIFSTVKTHANMTWINYKTIFTFSSVS